MARLPDVPAWFFQLPARECNRLADPVSSCCSSSWLFCVRMSKKWYDDSLSYSITLLLNYLLLFFYRKLQNVSAKDKTCYKSYMRKRMLWKKRMLFVSFIFLSGMRKYEKDKSWCTLTNGGSSCANRSHEFYGRRLVYKINLMRLEIFDIVCCFRINHDETGGATDSFICDIQWKDRPSYKYVIPNIIELCREKSILNFFVRLINNFKKKITRALIKFAEKSKLFGYVETWWCAET